MGRALLVLDTPADRQKASHWITKAPVGTRVEFKASKRSLPQNDLMWALLTEFSQQFKPDGKTYEPAQWKAIFLHAFGREITFLPSLDGKTFLPIEMSSSDLSKQEMTDFIEFIIKEAADRGVILQNPKDEPNSGSDPQPDKDEDSPSSSQEPADPPPLAGSSPNPETELLIRYARDVLPMAADPEATGAALAAIEREYASGEFKTLSTEGLERAKAISRSMRAIFNNETTLASALASHAKDIGCGVEELGG